jgi:hypothetical protein
MRRGAGAAKEGTIRIAVFPVRSLFYKELSS